ncbi:hypothetical protein EVAR_35330_1 [Eumeta japonica]|uniref:Reverse transcriptase domain-containing protein n=1 Tax=Eumeta variegata TaxID=151549 RepID=A0A4C1XK00_EUMVA|nr:hypothetical protein EVAR_35330_1 [Eumeta japonica]
MARAAAGSSLRAGNVAGTTRPTSQAAGSDTTCINFSRFKTSSERSKGTSYGDTRVTDRALDLLALYLVNRVQKVDVNNMRSSGSAVRMALPKRSILDPFLLLVYINDLPSLVKDIHEIVLFANDISLSLKVKRRALDYDDVM